MRINHSRRVIALCRRQQGLSLLEVLIAVLVLSIGMLGVAAMQTTNIKNSQSAHLRSVAVVLAAGMAERIRAQPQLARAGSFSLTKQCASLSAGNSLAQRELASWINDIRLKLGELETTCGAIVHDGNSRTYTVQVIWDDSRALGGLTAMTISNTVRY
jgi:type IV pilus assembly protein PilV